MGELHLVDFNDLFVIAVGASMAYIVIEARKASDSFFSILSKMTNIVKSMLLDYKLKPQESEEAVIAQIQYYLSLDYLEKETKGALKLVCDKAEEVMAKARRLDKWLDRKLDFHTKTDYLNVISFDSFLYGVFVLFVGALQNKCGLEIDGLLEVMLLYVALALLHCLVYERMNIKKKWVKIIQPTLFTHGVFIVIALAIGIAYAGEPMLDLSSGWLAILSVIASLIGFITYFFTTIIANIVLLVLTLIRIYGLKISSEVRGQKEDISRYQAELDEIEKRIKGEKLQLFFGDIEGVTSGQGNDS